MDFLRGKKLIHKENDVILADVALKKKTLILYYFTSANCEACRTFETKLKEIYHEAMYRRVELAVIVVCTENDKEIYLNTMGFKYSEWYAVQFEDELSSILIYNYGVTHIPTLVVVRKNGMLVTREGKIDVEKLGVNVLVTWSE